MVWQYRTILFEYQKDGLLGDKYIDEEEVEIRLNQEGLDGWELVGVTQIRDGLLAFCKRVEVAGAVMEDHGVSSKTESCDPVQSIEPEPITAEDLQMEEKAYIEQLERERQEAMKRQEHDLIGEIKIR